MGEFMLGFPVTRRPPRRAVFVSAGSFGFDRRPEPSDSPIFPSSHSPIRHSDGRRTVKGDGHPRGEDPQQELE